MISPLCSQRELDSDQRQWARCLIVGMCSFLWFTSPCWAESDDEYFESRIRPLLVQRCESCHSNRQGKTEHGLALDSRQGWQKGGESGPAIQPGKIDESLFIRAILYRDDGLKMPPEEAGGKLPEAEIALLTEWVRRGAHDTRTEAVRRGGMTEDELRAWWSFQPLKNPVVPVVQNHDAVDSEIDRFIQSRLQAEKLRLSPAADRQTLIRRATYDLTGLPPTQKEVDQFLSDSSEDAYKTLVDRLLESPHYGERWGRHWLDLVRYADTAGENTDHPIPDAWRYRNWVIDAFNRDLPYDQFVREQIAGDLLHAKDPAEAYAAGVVSTGFLAIARRFDHDSDKHMHLTFEDAIDTLGKTFLGLSIACARCHDHKYDPISANDYYALYGILNSSRFAFPGCEAKQQPRDLVPLLPPAEWARTLEPYDKKLAELDTRLKELADSQGGLLNELKTVASSGTLPLANGVVSEGGSQLLTASAASEVLQGVDVSVGQMILLTIDPQSNYGADTTLIEWELTEVGGTERRWNLSQDVTSNFLTSNPHGDRRGNGAVWWFLDPRNGLSLLSEPVKDLMGKPGLHVWRSGDNPAVLLNSTKEPLAVWTTLAPETVFVHPAPDGAVAIAWVSPIAGKVRISGRVADAHPGGPDGVGWSLTTIPGSVSLPLQKIAELSSKRTELALQKSELVSQAPRRDYAYAVMEGSVANARLHMRGDPEKLGDEVPRRWLDLFGGQRVPADAGSGRLQLANWLTDPTNPLVSRVMANRIWQYHFGKGLVQIPNDFGTRGQPPSHPELLDWLSKQLIESGWSLKGMHRLIMHSATYRQGGGDTSTEQVARSLAIDPTNQLYWRFDRRRLSAEELRDSLLVASQQIELSPGGPHPIPPAGSWSFSQHVPFTGVPETDRRSIYLLTLRNRRQPFMGLFDGADPNATTPQRQVTTVPTQSLYFLNDPFFHGQADKVARQVLRQSEESGRLNELFRIVMQRLPRDSERATTMDFLQKYQAAIAETPAGDQPLAVWSACARILLSSNQFLYVD